MLTANTKDKSPSLVDVVHRVEFHHNKVALLWTYLCETGLACALAGWSHMGIWESFPPLLMLSYCNDASKTKKSTGIGGGMAYKSLEI